MPKPCQVKLDNNTYHPGQTINGRVLCRFLSEEKVRAIRIRFKGKAKVYWKRGKKHYRADETYFEMVSDLLTCETTFPRGEYFYPFTFNLPVEIPPTLKYRYGFIKYFAEAVIDRPWGIDYKDKQPFTVHSYTDLNTINELKKPLNVTKVKRPFAFCQAPGKIIFSVSLPATGFVPLQLMDFTAKVKNDSNVDVQAVQFQLSQGFAFHSHSSERKLKTYKGEIYQIDNSFVRRKREKSWDLSIRFPAEVFAEDMQYCKIIKHFTILKGKLILPATHRDFKLKIPLTVGSVPLRS